LVYDAHKVILTELRRTEVYLPDIDDEYNIDSFDGERCPALPAIINTADRNSVHALRVDQCP
jgi:hypothetical protein